MRIKRLLQLWVGLLVLSAPSLTFARQRIIRLNPCEHFLLEANAIKGTLHDPNWVMAEAVRVYNQLEGKPLDVRKKTPIYYFRELLPGVIHMLRELKPFTEVSFTLVDPHKVDRDGGFSSSENPRRYYTTSKREIEKRIAEGLKHFRDNTATIEWFPMYLLEVLALKHYLKFYFHKTDAEKDKFLERHGKAKGALSEQLKSGMYLHWPTVAGLQIKHFDDWHLGIKPLGYSNDLTALYIFDQAADGDDYELYHHDIGAHFLPKEFFPFRRQFSRIKNRINMRLAFESDPDRKSLLRILNYMCGHEYGLLYKYFAVLKTKGYDEAARSFVLEVSYLNNSERTIHRLRHPHDFLMELTWSLQMMDIDKFKRQLHEASSTYINAVLEVFRE